MRLRPSAKYGHLPRDVLPREGPGRRRQKGSSRPPSAQWSEPLPFPARLSPTFGVAAMLLAVIAFAAPAAAVEAPKPTGAVDMAAVLKPGPLPELGLGDAKGVAMVEYGSLTCPHCATFDREVMPKLKAAYIDTGKAHYIFREFSRNALDVAAFMLARCVGDDKALAAIELLFSEQDKWAFVDKPLEPLIDAMRPTGLTHDKAMACLRDDRLAKKIEDIAKIAVDVVKLQGTPTFIIDGKVYDGELSFDELDAILKPPVK